MPRNPSELQRLEEEREHLIKELKGYKTKGEKVFLLRELRAVEKQLGITGVNYNSTEFGKSQDDLAHGEQ